MLAIIIPFPVEFVQRKKQRPLSKLMIANLIAAYSLERQGLFFGPQDIKGSSLINRGLIIRIEIPMNNKTQSIWHVSYQAIEMLKALGIDVICVKPGVKGDSDVLFLSLIEAYPTHSQTKCVKL